MRRMHKKGALELSINAIVIVILAMTLLGLGLGFVKDLFNKMGAMSDDTFEKMSERLNIDLASGDEDLLFSKTRMTIDRGGSSLEGLAVRNEGDSSLSYGIKIITFSCPSGWEVSSTDPTCKETSDWFEYFKGDNQYTVKAADSQVNKMQVNVPKSTSTGLYLIKIAVYSGDWPADNNCVSTGVDTGCETVGQTELFLTIS
jgi:hypothetical protein